MGKKRAAAGVPPPPAAPGNSTAPPRSKAGKKDAPVGNKPLLARGFLNANKAGNTSATVPAAAAPPPATNAREEVVCSVSSNPRLRNGAVLQKPMVGEGGGAPTTVDSGIGLNTVISDAKLGFIATDKVDNIVEDPLAKKVGWASLFGSNRNENKGYKLVETFSGVTSDGVVLDEDDIQLDAKNFWRLVGYFTPRFPGLDALNQLVKKWGTKCKSYQHASNWTVFTFDNEEDMNKVLEGGPYFIYGKSLYLKKMPDMFDFDWGGSTILPVWVQMPSLPLDLWNDKALGKLCTFIGKPLYTDAATKEKQRLSFARALVEVDVSVILPTDMPVTFPDKSVRRQKIFYEDVPKYCQTCKKMGHLTDTCATDKFATPRLYVKKLQKKFVKNAQQPVVSQAAPQKEKKKNVASTTEWVVHEKKNKNGKSVAKGDEVKATVEIVGNEEDEEQEDMREYGTDRGASDYVPTDGGDDEDEDEDEEDDDDEDDEESDDGSEDEGEPEIDRDTVVPTEAEIAEFFRTMDAMDGAPGTSVVDAGATVIALGANDKSVGIKNNTKGQKGEKMTTTSLSPLTLADIPIQEDKRAKKKTMQEELVLLRIEAKKKEDAWKAEREATLTRSRAKVAKRGD